MNAPNVSCNTCGARPGEPCKPTGTRPKDDTRWEEYRAASPHPSREGRARAE